MATIYNVMELATALKPFLLRHLARRAGAASATYLDPDIEVFAPLDDIAAAAERDGIVLTPHRLDAACRATAANRTSRCSPRRRLQPRVRVGRPPAARPFLDWWAERCRRDCLRAVPEGLFVDQRWVDLAVGYFPPLVLRDPGSTSPTGTSTSARLHEQADGLTAGGVPLRFLTSAATTPTSRTC